MLTQSNPHLAKSIIQELRPGFQPKIGIVLGSGLGSFAEKLENPTIIDYESLPGFPKCSVPGHHNNLFLGTLNGVEVVCLQGRSHFYEGAAHDVVRTYVRTLHLLGCEYFFATNASGSLREDVGPGELMLVTDHINMQPGNPLIGPNEEAFGQRFFPLDQAYHPSMRKTLLKIAADERINLHQGVYIAVSGPNYETAAEIRAFRILGADAVGMSTVPEVLVANHCSMKVAVIAMITNYATGLACHSHSHEAVVATAANAAEKLNRLLTKYIGSLGSLEI